MWPLFYAMFTAQAQEPAATGALRVEAIEPADSWAMALWKRAVRRFERQWRRTERRSETPGTMPEPPEPPEGLPVPGVTLNLDGMGVLRSCLTDQEGVCLFADLPPGSYRVAATKAKFRNIIYEGIQVRAAETAQQRIRMMDDDEDIIVTQNRATPDSGRSPAAL